MTWFYGKASGVKADIERHRKMEQHMDEKIAALEALPVRSAFDDVALRTYRHLRASLLQSKAEVVSKIGKQS